MPFGRSKVQGYTALSFAFSALKKYGSSGIRKSIGSTPSFWSDRLSYKLNFGNKSFIASLLTRNVIIFSLM